MQRQAQEQSAGHWCPRDALSTAVSGLCFCECRHISGHILHSEVVARKHGSKTVINGAHTPQKYNLQCNFFAVEQDRLSLGQVDLQTNVHAMATACAAFGRVETAPRMQRTWHNGHFQYMSRAIWQRFQQAECSCTSENPPEPSCFPTK